LHHFPDETKESADILLSADSFYNFYVH